MMRNIWPSHVSASPYVADLDFEEAIDSAIELARLSGLDDGADQAKPVGDESPPVSSREQLDCSFSTACLPAIGKPPVLGLCFQSKKWEPTALSAPMISKGKTYHRQNILCAAGSQICDEGLRHVPDRPTSHRFCIRVPTRRFRAAALTCGGTCLRASRVTRPGFPAPPRDLPRARRSCRRYRPCACDAR